MTKSFNQSDILEKMRLANQYFMDKWPDPGKEIITDRARPANIWTRAVYYEGLMALHSVDPQKKYYDYAIDWGTKHQWGMRGGIETRNADDQCCGQTYIDLYLLDKKQNVERIENIKSCIDKMVASDKVDDWWWIDALQMAMPVFVRLGTIYSDTMYFRRMYEMYAYSKYKHGDKGLYNPIDHLWWRDKDFDPPYKEPNGKDCYWSRGNGWVLVALARTLSMTPEYYSSLYKQYANFCENYPGAPLKKIVSGANADDYNWTEVCMKNIPVNQMWGISLHYYTLPTGNWRDKGSATQFDEKEYFNTMKNGLRMEEIVSRNESIMNRYDPQKRVALVVDEWGVWTNVEPGTIGAFLYQQNSMRDALLAGTTLNIFNNHAERVRVANLAQTVNVLQALVLTKGSQMLLTPTYHVFDLYKVHQDARLLPVQINTPDYTVGPDKIPAVNISASIDSTAAIHISYVNLDPNNKITVRTMGV